MLILVVFIVIAVIVCWKIAKEIRQHSTNELLDKTPLEKNKETVEQEHARTVELSPVICAKEELAEIKEGARMLEALEKSSFAYECELLQRDMVKLGRAVVPELLEYVKRNATKEFSSRGRVISVLGKIGDPAAVPVLLEQLKLGVLNAADALGEIGSPEAVPELIEALKTKVCRAAAEALGKIADERAIPGLLEMMKGYNSDNTRVAVCVLEKLGWQPTTAEEKDLFYFAGGRLSEYATNGAELVPGLLQILKNKAAATHERIASVYALGHIGDTRAVAAILEWVEFENSLHAPITDNGLLVAYSDYSGVGAEALVAMGRPAVPLLLAEAGRGHRGVIKALGMIGDEQAVPDLLSVADGDFPYSVIDDAIVALRMIGGSAAVSGILEFAKESRPGYDYRYVAASREIWNIKEPRRALLPLLGAHYSTAVEFLLKQVEPEERFPILIEALSSGDTADRLVAAKALGQLGDAQALPALLAALEDGNSAVRRNAATSLELIGDARAVPGLVAELADCVADNRQAAAFALENVDWKPQKIEEEIAFYYALQDWDELIKTGQPAVRCLLGAMTDESEPVREAATAAVVKMGSGAVPVLLAVLADKSVDMRRSAAKVLGLIGDAEAIPPLLAVLIDSNFPVRREAAEALKKLGWRPETTDEEMLFLSGRLDFAELKALGPNAVPSLLEALRCEDYDARFRAAVTLGEIGDASVVPDLVKALKDENLLVRDRSAGALREIGDARAVPGLVEALTDSNYCVRGTSAKALGKIGDVRAVPGLKEALKDEHHGVRWDAKEALQRIEENKNLQN